MLKRFSQITLFLILAVSLSLAADNQVVTSSRLALISESGSADMVHTWQNYSGQLGYTASSSDTDYDHVLRMRLFQARSDINYPVTVGDVYSLSYIYNNTVVTVPVSISHSGSFSIPNIGSFSWKEKTYNELKNEVENAVTARYPFSNPEFEITATGSFSVRISGHVSSSQRVPAWGLSRLSDLIPYASDNASTRSVSIISSDGTSHSYDLFAALMEGDESDNPLLRPDDHVIFNMRGAMVLVNGCVMRSGSYQISEETTLDVFIERYALGFSNQADLSAVSVTRYENGNYREIKVEDLSAFVLQDGDMIDVKSVEVPVGSVTLHGALLSDRTSSGSFSVQGQVSSQYFYRFIIGDTVEDMLVEMSPYFTSSSDLDGCYLTRDGKNYPISFRSVLYGEDPDGDIILQNGDSFTVPFSNQVVTVNGAVNNPGTYAYVPGKDVSYYVNLAGGLASSAKGLEKYTLYNSYGEKIDRNSPISAETTIEMDKSTFSQDLAIAVSVIGVVSTITTIILNCLDIAGR